MYQYNPILLERIDILTRQLPKPGKLTKILRPEKAKQMMQARANAAKRIKSSIGKPNHPNPMQATHDVSRAEAYANQTKDKWDTIRKLGKKPSIYGEV